MDQTIDDLKTMLDISDNDEKVTKVLKLIVKNTSASLRVKLGLKNKDNIPESLSYIVLEVSIRRYNRMKNEGMKSYGQEGESITYQSTDFDDFLTDIDDYKAQQANSANSKGILKVISAYGGK